MAITLKPVHDQVIVITGASSGIGLATARAAAAKGARVVLAARNWEVLQGVEKEINDAGGHAIHVVADVSRREDVQRIATAAIERFGGFDTWVNNAGLTIYGRLDQVSLDDQQRLFQVNYWSQVYGSLIALEHFKRRGGGAIINMGSIASDIAYPLQGTYCASKHAVRAFTHALRMELEAEGAPISVTLVKPAGINTPFDHHAKNYLDQEPQLTPPVYDPSEVAYAILHAAQRPQRVIYVGGGGKLLSALYKEAPKLVEWMNETVLMEEQQRDEPPRQPEGGLYQAHSEGKERGDYPGHVMKWSYYTRAKLSPAVRISAFAALGLVALAVAGLMTNGKKNYLVKEGY
jgi:short-subunit dehydrogenase